MYYKLGSLFDGSGGFPLAGTLCGISPIWAAEVEPYPIAVTRSRFPNMKHFGDVSKIDGAEIEPVDIITFGSPCQDLSVAGKRAGLKHTENGDEETTRSGLFMEAIRIIREMREATGGEYPRFAVWENVPGAFSSNKGEDFRIVLEEFIKINEPSVEMPAPGKTGWPYSDCYVGDGWSVAYRTFDAQHWGVPQRRRRIYLVADFRGGRAGEILFERDSLRGYFAEGCTPWKRTTRNVADCSGTEDSTKGCLNSWDVQSKQIHGINGVAPSLYAGECRWGGGECYVMVPNDLKPYTLKIRSGCEGGGKGALIQEDMSATLATNNDQYLFQPVCYNSEIIAVATQQGGAEITTNGICPTVTAAAGMSGNNQPWIAQYLFENHSQDTRYRGPLAVCPIVSATYGMGGNNQPFVVSPVVYESHPQDSRVNECGDVSPTVTVKYAKGAADTPLVCSENAPYQKATGPLMANSHPGSYSGQDAYTDMFVVGKGKPVAYSFDSMASNSMKSSNPHSGCREVEVSKCLDTTNPDPSKNQGGIAIVQSPSYGLGRDVFNQGANAQFGLSISEEVQPSMVAKGPGGVATNYTVRRLTPTECARLQGFPDFWGHIPSKEDFTDEEYQFWLNARNTHATINGKQVKDYTKAQMLTWYNKLHTDSSEYKMWGNGIALPNALYVMQGIADTIGKSV